MITGGTNDGIIVNPPRKIGRISPNITRTIQGILDIFNYIRGTSNLSDRTASWHGKKSEIENPEGNTIFKNTGRENNFEVEKFGHKNYVIFNHVNSNNINTDSNHSNHADSNHTNLNKLVTADLTIINDSADVRALNKFCHGMGTWQM